MQGIADEINAVFDMSAEVDSILAQNITNTNLLSDGTKTPEDIVNLLVSPVEFRLSNMKQMIKQLQTESYKMVGLEIGVGLGITAISSGFKNFHKVYKNQAASGSLLSQFGSKMKLTFKSMWTSTKSFFSNFKANVKNMGKNTFNSLKSKIANPKGVVKTYFKGISAAHTFVNGMGAAAGAVMIFISHKQWKDVDQVSYFKYSS